MLLENAIEEQFMVENNRNIYQFVDTPAQLMAALKNSTITAPQLNRNKKI
jgi:predicted Rossmann-fold nucleotide-binding protein